MNTKLYVGNLSFDATENEIQDMFTVCGPVNEVNLIMDRMTNRSRGFAFVVMATEEGAQAAIQQLAGKEINGRALTVNEARPREERVTGNRGFGGGGGHSYGERQYARR
jgi:RNA recognition motif-containing protein